MPAEFPSHGGRAVWQNHGDEAREVIVQVGHASPTSLVDLAFELRPIGYDLETGIVAACDDLSAARFTVVRRRPGVVAPGQTIRMTPQ